MLRICSAVFVAAVLVASGPGTVERTIRGTAFLSDNTPAHGYRVRAFDDDPVGDDEQMAETVVDAAGNYAMSYRPGTWDGPKVGTQWRPDIYIVIAKPLPGGGWRRVDQSGVRADWAVRNDITHNFRIPDDGECPATAKFATTGVWRGCNCPQGTYKRWLDALHYEARCAAGISPRAECDRQGATWVGVDNRYGRCVRESDIPSAHRWVQREAYRKYMRRVSDGVQMEALPGWVVSRYQSYYPNVRLDEITIGESRNTPSSSTAITDCKKIYYPSSKDAEGKTRLERVRSETAPSYFLLLHEIAHSEQCMALDPGMDLSTKRDKYADMWFGNLPLPVLLSILEDGIPVDNSVHDKMPMEQDADRQAARIIQATGIGRVPVNSCPTGVFSTREHRGCACPAGTTKSYSGTFSDKAECKR